MKRKRNKEENGRHSRGGEGKYSTIHKRWMRRLFRRRVITVLLLIIQLAFILYAIVYSSRVSTVLTWCLNIFSVVVCVYILNKHDKGSFKLAWIFQILLFPLFGGMLYVFFMSQSSLRRFALKYHDVDTETRPLFLLSGDELAEASAVSPDCQTHMRYLQNKCGFPVYGNTETKFLPSGEEKLECLLAELKKAEKYIFLEYFIISEGKMWSPILQILCEKAAAGVKVRVMYDDVGCFLLLPENYPKQLASYGIECIVFNRFIPFLSTRQNNRDHRKIVSIDGKVAFTGGINIGDEYINAVDKHGHWKDCSVMLRGNAAWSLTLIFLEMWKLCCDAKDVPYKPEDDFMVYYPGKMELPENGYVQPYADSPLDDERVGEHVYMQMITNAKKYLYITTPYLILDDSMVTELCLAAKSGVDVRIITPQNGDHGYVHATTRSYYRDLIAGGVRIYEYKNGFIHAKMFVSDDKVATVGTINLDFRSLYMHFECGTVLNGCSAVSDIREDLEKTINRSVEITEQDCHFSFTMRVIQTLLRLFAPLM